MQSWLILALLVHFVTQCLAGSNANKWYQQHLEQTPEASYGAYGRNNVPTSWDDSQSHHGLASHSNQQDSYHHQQSPYQYIQNTYIDPHGFHAQYYPVEQQQSGVSATEREGATHAATGSGNQAFASRRPQTQSPYGDQHLEIQSAAHEVTDGIQGMSLVDSLLSRPAMPLPQGIQLSSERRRRTTHHDGLVLSMQQAAQAIGLDPRRLERERSSNARSRATNRNTMRINMDEVMTADLPHLATRPWPKRSTREKRQLLMDAWEQRGLNFETVEPEDLARQIAKIKLELGYDSTIGQLAAKKVLDEAPTREFKVVYQVFSKIYSNRISYLRGRARENPIFDTRQQMTRWVYLRMKPLRSFDYRQGIREDEPQNQQNIQAERVKRAKKVWEHFMDARVLNNNDVQEENLDVNWIEYLSRGLTYRQLTQAKTTEMIKLYMGLFLGVNETGLYRFTHQRARARIAFRVEKEKEVTKIRREGRGTSSTSRVIDEDEEAGETYGDLYEQYDRKEREEEGNGEEESYDQDAESGEE